MVLLCASLALCAAAGRAQAAAQPPVNAAPSSVGAAPPHVSGAVQTVGDGRLTLDTAAGVTVTVVVPQDASLLLVAPGSTSLVGAKPARLEDIAAGDKVLVTGTAGDTGTQLTAHRIVVIKATAIAAENKAVDAAWQNGGGGVVKSVTGDHILVASGEHMLTIVVTPRTQIRRYAADSASYADTINGTLAQVEPGEQLRVRGERSGDGTIITADAIVSGSFQNLSGLLTAVDGTAGTLSLKDLATRQMFTVEVTPRSVLHRLPPQAAARMAARARGQGVSSEGTTPGSAGAAASGPGGSARAGFDLSQMLASLPTETLGDLKAGDAVMLVASKLAGGQDHVLTLLVGVEPILKAAPQGEMTLEPWDVGGGSPTAQ